MLDFYAQEEQEELRLLRDSFFFEIMEVSDSLFAWRNYLLPKRFIEPSVFYCRHGLSRLKTLDTVKGRAVIDAGGCIGDSALIFAELPLPPSTPLSPCPTTLRY